jgi:hypothetical protein
MSGDFFTHNDRQPCISTYSTLKWDSTGELSELDMNRILELLEKSPSEVTQMGMSNPRWKNGSVMQE